MLSLLEFQQTVFPGKALSQAPVAVKPKGRKVEESYTLDFPHLSEQRNHLESCQSADSNCHLGQAGGSVFLTSPRGCQHGWSVGHRALRCGLECNIGITQKDCRCHVGGEKKQKTTHSAQKSQSGKEGCDAHTALRPSHQPRPRR